MDFSDLLVYFKELIPLENEMPILEYKAKKTISIRNGVGKIHVCPNDCILYHKVFLEANRCSVCKYSGWKLNSSGKDRKGILAKMTTSKFSKLSILVKLYNLKA